MKHINSNDKWTREIKFSNYYGNSVRRMKRAKKGVQVRHCCGPSLHREDGPAIEKFWLETVDGVETRVPIPSENRWYIHGKKLTGPMLARYKHALKTGNEQARQNILGIIELQNDKG